MYDMSTSRVSERSMFTSASAENLCDQFIHLDNAQEIGNAAHLQDITTVGQWDQSSSGRIDQFEELRHRNARQ